ncbi:MAG: diacylglycerol kinase family protein [Clostridiales bacterium]|jgi:diacylglycerol kinase (ATP)|nr:diacylglycerol kinase family protein [Clostridiales bacterium]
MKKISLRQSFHYAFEGIVKAVKDERNFKIHLCAAIIALGLATFLKASQAEFMLLLISITMVLTAELINTAIERAVDLYCGDKFNRLAKIAKDTAAGAVMLTAINALAVGYIVFFDKIAVLIDKV